MGVAAAAVGLAGVGTAAAAPSPTTRPPVVLQALKDRCIAAIDARQVELDRLANQIGAAKNLTAGDSTALTQTVGQQKSGLAALRASIVGDADVAATRTDCQKIVPDYHVYILTEPKAHLTIAADATTAASTTFDAVAAKLQAQADKEQAQGKDVSAADAALTDMKAKDADARAKAGGVPAVVLPLTPADYDTGHERDTLVQARGTLVQARGDLGVARQDAAMAAKALGVPSA
jgi:hypothetical protein